jgi:hypothetical protein
MSDQNSSSTSQPNIDTTEILYAGKFKTVGELEAGYKNSLPTFQENENLKKQLEQMTKVPEMYNTPADIALHESDLSAVQHEAKSSGLTQAQYEKLVRERNALSLSKHQSYEQAKKDLGADNLNMLQDFIKKTYPEKAAEVLLRQAIMNKELRESIFSQRSEMLNSSIPGTNRISVDGKYNITEKDVLKAREDMNSLRGRARVEARNRYIAMQHHRAHNKV